MTFAEIRALAAQLQRADIMNFAADLATGDGTSTPVADQKSQVNTAYRWLARQARLVKGDVALTFQANTYRYSLSGNGWDVAKVAARCVTVRQVELGGTQLLDFARKPGLVSLDEMNALADDWQTGGSAGTVERAMQLGDVLWLYPKPLADVTGLAVAEVIPPDLVADGDIPWLPDELHECLAMATAAYAGAGTATDTGTWARINAYDSQAQARTVATAQRNVRMLGLDSYEMAAKGEN